MLPAGMLYRDYGRTGKKISLLGFGGMRFEAIDDTDACVAMMVAAAEAGVNYFDTAPGYFDGKSEIVFGAGLAELRRRGLPCFCSTKTERSAPADIRREIESQLTRMRVDRIDFYHVWCITKLEHWRARKAAGVLGEMRRLKEEGLVGHVCVSSHLVGDEIRELLDEGIFEGVLLGYSAYDFHSRRKALDELRGRGLGCVVMNPLGGGVIPQNPSLFGFLKDRADQPVVEAALHFLFSHEMISSVLVGFGTLGHVREATAAAASFRGVSAARVKAVQAAAGPAFAGLCTGCAYCDECPEEIPIPKMMDAWNHGQLYQRELSITERLDWHWDLGPGEASRCTRCGRCEELCTQHLPIMDRMAQIAALPPRR
jgi:predicted aldo/keto reductase-like oxidoreductase